MSGNVLVFLDAAEGTFADCANIRVHLALRDAENSERHSKWTADRDRHAHLIPAASADKSMVRSDPMHLTTISPNNASHSSPRVATGTQRTLDRTCPKMEHRVVSLQCFDGTQILAPPEGSSVPLPRPSARQVPSDQRGRPTYRAFLEN